MFLCSYWRSPVLFAFSVRKDVVLEEEIPKGVVDIAANHGDITLFTQVEKKDGP